MLYIQAEASLTCGVRKRAWSDHLFLERELMELLGSGPRVLALLLRHFGLGSGGDRGSQGRLGPSWNQRTPGQRVGLGWAVWPYVEAPQTLSILEAALVPGKGTYKMVSDKLGSTEGQYAGRSRCPERVWPRWSPQPGRVVSDR